MTWQHDALARDLAGYLRSPERRMIWLDMQLGPSGSPRPDVYTIEKSYSRPAPMAFEVKVSKSDLRSDLTSGKWQSYLAYAGGVVFAVPDGLCTPADIPTGCGLIVRKAEVWRYARKPTVAPVKLGMEACMKLLMDGLGRTVGPEQPQPRHINTWTPNKAVLKRFGEDVAIAAKDLANARHLTESIKSRYDYERKRVDEGIAIYKDQLRKTAEKELTAWTEIRDEVCAWLGLRPGTAAWQAEDRLEALRKEVDADERVKSAEAIVQRARATLESALRCLPEAPKPEPAQQSPYA